MTKESSSDEPTSSQGSDEPHLPLTPAQDYALGNLQVVEHQVVKELQDRLKTEVSGLSHEKQVEVTAVAREVLTENLFYFTADMPPPGFLKQIEEVSPGSAAQIIAMTVEENRHRRQCELREIDQDDEQIRLKHREATHALTGLVLGFATLVVLCAAGVFALLRSQPWIASICFGSGLAGPIGLFAKSRMSNNNDDAGQRAEADTSRAPHPKVKVDEEHSEEKSSELSQQRPNSTNAKQKRKRK
jgi:uncharacterized membrane protein